MNEPLAQMLDMLMRVVGMEVIKVGIWGAMYLGVGLTLVLVAKYLPSRNEP